MEQAKRSRKCGKYGVGSRWENDKVQAEQAAAWAVEGNPSAEESLRDLRSIPGFKHCNSWDEVLVGREEMMQNFSWKEHAVSYWLASAPEQQKRRKSRKRSA